ncbi:hypothetical protein KA062_03100 [Patescibacteria group bacterium]|nr:hypothetical protein [Patescibacteria group bacterium]
METEEKIGFDKIEGLGNREDYPSLENPEFLRSGLDYKVFLLEDVEGKKWVYKEPNNLDLGGNLKSPEEIARLTSPEGIFEAIEEEKILKEIYGERYFLENHYTYGKNMSGEDSLLLFQEFVDGKTLDRLIGEGREYVSLEELVYKNREQFMDLWSSSIKAFQEFDIPIDVHEGNFIMDSNTGNIYLLDWGRPSFELRRFQESSETLSEDDDERVSGIFKRIKKMDEIERYLNLTEEEKNLIYDKHGISEEKIKENIKELEDVNQKREEAKIEKKRQEITDFLTPLLDDNKNIDGKKIIEETGRFIEENGTTEIPEMTKKTIERLSTMGDKVGNIEYWISLILE